MAKKYPPGYIKDPKKVSAGKARAANAIRNKKGQYIPRIFQSEIERTFAAIKLNIDVSKISQGNIEKVNAIIKNAKVSKKEIKDFYEKNPIAFENLIETGALKSTNKSTSQLENVIADYKGKIFVFDGTETVMQTKAQAKYRILKFLQYIKTYANAVELKFKPTYTIDGKLTINIPNEQLFLKKLKEYFDVTSFKDFNEFTSEEMNEAIASVLEEIYNGEPDIVIISSP